MRFIKDFAAGLALIVACFVATTPSCVNDPIFINPIDTTDMDTIIPPDTSAFCDPDTIYFRKDVLPIIRSSCGMGFCHDNESMSFDIEITSYETLISAGIVEPFDPEGSRMYQVMTSDNLSELMPPNPRGPISDTNIVVIRKWIEQGAQNLDCPDDTTCVIEPPVSFAQDIFPIMDKYCIGCHSGNNPWAGLFLRDHAEIADASLNGDLLPSIRHDAGFPEMPKDIDKLLDCDIEKVRLWIEAGAPNN